ncbi:MULTISPECIES: hypothetical protein [unclassified Vibrio]|uniref:hypothetical protein n=1 Tax=unclassified Vibrio TaxID=2614977 RepID=UPI0019299DB6|nr:MULTISPECIES: hypothetical protein [unclassified Vibrio]
MRSFVALPIEKGGSVIRFAYEHNDGTDVLLANAAYGLSANQAILLGLPYRLSPDGPDRQDDVSVLFRHIVWQHDSLSGTRRLGLLGGAIVPTESNRDAALQAGFVMTYFQGRHEWDLDALYQAGLQHRPDSGRYDISWQYRLAPDERPEWGLPPELNSVLEFNGRWNEDTGTVHQITTGLQWVHKEWVIEGGLIKELNKSADWRYILSTRFHF